jgi:hypothetical protein
MRDYKMNITGNFGPGVATIDLTDHSSPTVAITTGSGNTVQIEISLTPNAINNPLASSWRIPDVANFNPPLTYPITTGFISSLIGVCTAIRFTRTAGNSVATWEIAT